LLIEGLTFKIIQDFFIFLDKNKIVLTGVKVDFFDRTRHEFINFNNLDEVKLFYSQNYVPINNCVLGDLSGIQQFTAVSNVYGFTTTYKISDLLENAKIIQGGGFDRNRTQERNILKERQFKFIQKSIKDYLRFYNELKFIYSNGIYSPCYAEPGWSENTWFLNELRGLYTNPNNGSQFPYVERNINRKPPN